jgi:GcrA cell cycle regulator
MTRRAICDVNTGYKVYHPYFWTEDRVKQLIRLISDNLTASEVGKVLGCTKNMVIGKCYRDYITLPRSNTSRRITPPTPNPFPERGCCLWGIGSPGEPGFHFCGESNAPDNRNYCSKHAAKSRRKLLLEVP